MNSKIPSLTMFLLMAIGVLSFGLVFNETYEPILYTMYVFLGLALISAIVASVLGAIASPKSLKSSLVGFGAMFAVLLLAYLLAGDEVLDSYGAGITAGISKLTDTGLYTFYILFIGAIGAIIYSAINRILKKS